MPARSSTAADRSWELGVGGSQSGFDRDTFYVWLMAPQAAIARDRASI